MPAYVAPFSSYYNGGGIGSSDIGGNWDNGTITDGGDDIWTIGEALTDTSGSGIFFNSGATYQGTITVNGNEFPVVQLTLTGAWVVLFNNATNHAAAPATMPAPNTSSFTACFMQGTGIAAPNGSIPVEDLKIGQCILANDGRTVAVKWIGKHSVTTRFFAAQNPPVRIRAGAFGAGVPHSDLVVTADHGMVIDGLVINASALVNGGTIDWVPGTELPAVVTYYHIETEAHDVILANGAPAETFMDAAGRGAFDNHQEYLDLYGVERIIPEMPRPRINAQRLLPAAIKARLGVDGLGEYPEFEQIA